MTDTQPVEDDEALGARALQRRLVDLLAGNQHAAAELERAGVQINPIIELAIIELAIRLETLIDGIIPADQRLVFEVANAERLNETLTSGVADAKTAQAKRILTAGIRPNGGPRG